MAILVSQGGNFNTSTTWNVVNTTSFVNSNGTGYTISDSIRQSTTFTPGAATVKGVVLYMDTRENLPTGSEVMTVTLRRITPASAATDINSVTVPLAYLPGLPDDYASSHGIGWGYFEFPNTGSTLIAATQYAIRVSASTNNGFSLIKLFGNATGISRGLVTTANAVPAGTDTLLIVGKYDNVSGSFPTTIMDNNVARVFDDIYITAAYLDFLTSANTTLRTSGGIFVGRQGVLTIGKPSNPIQSAVTATVLISATTLGTVGITIHGGEFSTHGAYKIPFAEVISAGPSFFSGNYVAASGINSEAGSGWRAGDRLFFSSLSSRNGYNSVANNSIFEWDTFFNLPRLTSNLLSEYGGGTRSRSDVFNLTRNVKLGVAVPTRTRSSFISVNGLDSKLNLHFTEITNFCGTGTTTCGIRLYDERAITLDFTMSGCTFYNTDATTMNNAYGINYAWGGSGFADGGIWHNFMGNVVGNMKNPYKLDKLNYNYTSPPVFRGNGFFECGTVELEYLGPDSSNNVICNSSSKPAVTVLLDRRTISSGQYTMMNNWKVYSNSAETFNNIDPIVKFHSLNTASSTSQTTPISNITINNWQVFGNEYTMGGAIRFQDFTLGDFRSSLRLSGFTMNNNDYTHISLGPNIYTKIIFDGGWFVGGQPVVFAPSTMYCVESKLNDVAHTEGPPLYPGYFSSLPYNGIFFTNNVFGRDSAGTTRLFGTSVFNVDYMAGRNVVATSPINAGGGNFAGRFGSLIRKDMPFIPSLIVTNLSGTSGVQDIIYYPNSDVLKDFANPYPGESYSLRITPSFYGNRTLLTSPLVRIPVLSGQSCTVSVNVKTVNYTGSSPTLIYMFNPIVGNVFVNNVTGATMSVGNNIWETLTYTTPRATYDGTMEFFIQSENVTNGYVNVGKWTTNLSNDTRGEPVWSSLVGAYSEPDFSPPTTGGTTSQSSYTFIG